MKATICVPLYNVDPRYLDELLSSLETQTSEIAEVIVLDDKSSVDYAEVVNRHSSLPGFRFIRNERNLGMVGNWNANIRMASGDYFVVLGHDDRLTPRALATFREAFNSGPNVVMVGTGVAYIDGNGNAVELPGRVNDRRRIFCHPHPYLLKPREVAYLTLRNGCPLGELSAVAYRRESALAAGLFDPEFRHAADVEFALRVSRTGLAIYVPSAVVERRLHLGNLTNRNYLRGLVSADRERLFLAHRNSFDFTPSEISLFRVRLALTAMMDLVFGIRMGSTALLRSGLSQLLRYGPTSLRAYYSGIRELITGRNLDAR